MSDNLDLYQTGPFRHVSDMEEPLANVSAILSGLALSAETMDDNEGVVVARLAWLGLREYEAIGKLRRELFRLTHPNREHFEKEGWPA